MIVGAVVGLLAIVLAAWTLRVRRYRAGLRVPARRDDRLCCRVGQVELGVSVAADGFDLPPGLERRRGQTALLALTVGATPHGRLFDPFIEMGDGQTSHRQYFERGAAGQRYLNLSPLWQRGDGALPARVGLRGSSMRWSSEGRLLLFDPPALESASLLVLAPHPDDAEVAAFGMYAGRRSWVVTVTAGEKWTAALPVAVSPGESARRSALLRVTDSLTIPQLGQVPRERCVNLAYPDGELAGMYRDNTRPFRLACEASLSRASLRSRNQTPEFQRGDPACTWNDLVADLRLSLEKAQPDIVLCPHPLIDGHPDHVFTTVALERAMRELGPRPPRVFLYVVHRRDVPIYPFGPAESLVSLPPWGDDRWIAESIYSHPLTPETRRMKAFALEAMHGVLKDAPGDPRSSRQVLESVKREISSYIAGTGLLPSSLLRRAPRPNEIYYLVSGSALSELTERALDTA